MNHYELCKLTAERFLKNNYVVLYEYNNTCYNECPDVLCYKDCTTLFEIKISYQDFKNDHKKECRIKYDIKYFPKLKEFNKIFKINWRNYNYREVRELIKESPHLGKYRYYVCPSKLIQPKEVPNGWGLYWFKNNKFFLKKRSKQFRNNIHKEIEILSHAFRKYASGNGDNILINTYDLWE